MESRDIVAKKVILTICVLAVLLSVFAAIAPRTEAAEETVADYQVGYARVDINPYVVDGDLSSGIMALPLYGSGDVWNRLSTDGLVDDNGDGKVNEEDGLKATCIAITDYTGNTVLLITIDMIGGLMSSRIHAEIVSRVEAAVASGELPNVKLTSDQIYYNGTHTHNAPATSSYVSAGMTGTNNDGVDLSVVNENLGVWIERTVEDVGDAAILALKDRAAAAITKDAISASEDTSTLIKGKVMNSVRHYNNEAGDCVAGDNFNDRGSDPKQVTQVNDTLYLLKFDFSAHNAASGDSKLPIVLANWRAHPSLNNSSAYKKSSSNCISSDFVNSFRYNLENNATVLTTGHAIAGKATYRVAFFQGAGGNVNPRGYEITNGVAAYNWIDTIAQNRNESRGNIYGRFLSVMAKNGLNSSANRETVSVGEIRTLQYSQVAQRKNTGITALAYEAAVTYQTGGKTGRYVHTNAAGETYVIASKYHANNIVSSWNESLQMAADSFASLELNAIKIGENLAFVTASGEIFDYYYQQEGVFTEENNKWNNLISEEFGTPFVLELCNGMNGYVPNSYAYEYNLGSTKWATGAYESHTTSYAQGTGEAMIDSFALMLGKLSESDGGTYDALCQHCGEAVTWSVYNGKGSLNTGHYYLMADNGTPQIHINKDQQVCFDLNGYTLKGETRAFYTYSEGNATLNLMDSSEAQTGRVLGCGASLGACVGFGGGVIVVDKGNTLNLYGGTLEFYEKGLNSVSSGGVLRSMGTVNMYGGTIGNSVTHSFKGDYVRSGAVNSADRTAYGAAVHFTGNFNMYGGTIETGSLCQITGTVTQNADGVDIYSQTVTEKDGVGACIYAGGKLTVAGDARIADVYYNRTSTASYFCIDMTAAPFTGNVLLTYKSPAENAVVGSCTGTQGLTGSVMISGTAMNVKASEGQLIAATGPVLLMDGNTCSRSFDTVDEALAAYTYNGANYIQLSADVNDSITVDKSAYLNLNGYYITGRIAVKDGAALYCMDTQTDDYTIDDEMAYGMLTGELSGNVSAADGYIRINEKNGASFHRVELQINAMSLRAADVGVYYTCSFRGDEVVADEVLSYGVVLSLMQEPDLGTYSSFKNFQSGTSVTGTLLRGIMKTENSAGTNQKNGEALVYGRPYIQTGDGFVFGDCVARSLQQQLEDIDLMWGELTQTQKASVLKLYSTYATAMDTWTLPNIRQAATEQTA